VTIKLPEIGGEHEVYQWDIDGWQRVYQHINVEAELEKMRVWLEENPKKRKKNTRTFVINWLSRAEEKAPKEGRAASAYRDRVQRAHHEEMKKPAASKQVGFLALAQAWEVLGRHDRAAELRAKA